MTGDYGDFLAYVHRIVPAHDRQWIPADAGQVRVLAGATEQPLPPFYEWFLGTMGRSMGAMTPPELDFSATSLVDYYSGRRPHRMADRLVIGLDDEGGESGRLYVYYALDRRAQGDALVCHNGSPDARADFPSFESFREMLTWHTALRYGVETQVRTCEGRIDSYEDVIPAIDTVAATLRFTQPVAMNQHCRLFERSDATLTMRRIPTEEYRDCIYFHLGAKSEAVARVILGALGLAPGLSIGKLEWTSEPPE